MLVISPGMAAKEYHVAKDGNDDNPGSAERPYLTIQAAADVAQPGDVITVHEGIYRERITPPRGGESDASRITYRAAPGGKVGIKGSEVIRDWKKFRGDVWKRRSPMHFSGITIHTLIPSTGTGSMIMGGCIIPGRST
jgi:alpha-N-arabinofuranosidase